MKILGSLLLLGMVSISEAQAASPGDWVACDGYAAPGGWRESVKRWTNGPGAYGPLGLNSEAKLRTRAVGDAGVAACGAVLFDEQLPHYPLRHANILRMRGFHWLEAGDPQAALADLGDVRAAAGALAGDRFFARSMGLSVKFFQAHAWRMMGNDAAANQALAEIAAERPYSPTLLLLALELVARPNGPDAAELAILDALVKFEPAQLRRRAEVRGWLGDPAGALADYRTLFSVAARDPELLADLSPAALGEVKVRAALAAARAGGAADARRWLGETPSAIATPYAPLVEAWIEYSQGDINAARARLGAEGTIKVNPDSLDLVEVLQRDLAPMARDGILNLDVATTRARALSEIALPLNRSSLQHIFDRVSVTESSDYTNRYKSRGLFDFGKNGFKDVVSPDGGGYSIEYIGTKSSMGSVEEMTLLRAADIALELGRAAFVIIGRDSYQRYQGGDVEQVVEESGVRAGYQSKIEIKFVADGDPLAFATDQVLRDLAPIYLSDR